MSIRKIAARAGVSIATVSRTLNAPEKVDPGTAARVKRAIADLDYWPNLSARALVTGRTRLIGLIVPSLIHSFFAELSQGLSRELRQDGFSLVVAPSDEDPAIEQEIIRQLLARGVDSLLIASVQQDAASFKQLTKHHVPFILLDRKIPGLSTNFIGVDDEEVGRIATEHLIEIGCQRIAHVGGTQISTALGRLRGYERTLQRHGIPLNPDYVIMANRMDEGADAAGYQAALRLLSLDPAPDGIFCYNDPVAYGVMTALLDKGIRIPEDIALVGSGNLHSDTFLPVPLSSVDQQSRRIGERAAQLAISLVKGDGQAPAHTTAVLLDPALVIRNSTKKTRHI